MEPYGGTEVGITPLIGFPIYNRILYRVHPFSAQPPSNRL